MDREAAAGKVKADIRGGGCRAGDGQTRDDGFSGKYQRTGRKGERRHTENLMDGI